MTIADPTATERRATCGDRRAHADIRIGVHDDLELLKRFLDGLSPETLYRRFLTGFGAFVPPGLARTLLAPGDRAGSLLAIADGEVVGHAMWAPVVPETETEEPASTAEVGLLVADALHGRGIGSRLADALRPQLSRHGYTYLRAVVSAENEAVRQMIRHRVPDAVHVRDGSLVTATVPVGSDVRGWGADPQSPTRWTQCATRSARSRSTTSCVRPSPSRT